MSDLETDIQRVERMLQTCGCSPKKARRVLEECLRRNKIKMDEGRLRNNDRFSSNK